LQIIPVLDVRHGVVVRAIGGQRDNYRPIETQMAPGTAEPIAIARALLKAVGDGRILYVADLDGIEGRGRRVALIEAMSAALGDVTILLDCGVRTAADVLDIRHVVPVVGSENLTCAEDLRAIGTKLMGRFVLSLDWRGDQRLGPDEVFQDPKCWPDRVIVMTLARVGSGMGPDIAKLEQIKAMAGPARQVFAAGGVRSREDLRALRQIDIAGALLASALHNQTLTADDVSTLK